VPRKLGNWIKSYEDYVGDTESPFIYNKWTAIHCLSATLKRSVYVIRGFYKIYANQYIILVGPPGVGKGTAINPAISLTKLSDTTNYISDRTTAEKIIDILAAGFPKIVTTSNAGMSVTGSNPNPNVTLVQGTLGVLSDTSASIISTELPMLLNGSELMLPLLCELWDKNEFDYNTKTKGSRRIKDLCVGLLGGCVPDYIRKLNKDAMASINSGFTSRCIFVFASDKAKKIAWPLAKQGSQLEQDLIEDLKYIQNTLQGQFKFDMAAYKAIKDYYDDIKPEKFDTEVTGNFKARMLSHILKCCMTLSIAESDSLSIELPHVEEAIKLIEDVLATLDVTFRNVGESNMLVAMERVMDYVEATGIATRIEIAKATYRHVTDFDLDRILFTAEKSLGYISQKSVGKNVCYADTGVRKRERLAKIPSNSRNGHSNKP